MSDQKLERLHIIRSSRVSVLSPSVSKISRVADGKSEARSSEDISPPPVQPDGGWGWVVCFTSMCANGTVIGSSSNFGIVYVALLEKYAKNDPNISFKTAWIGSVNSGLSLLMSVFASILSDRYGTDKVAFAGGCLSFIGMLSSAFVEQLMWYYLTYGVILGTGYAFTFNPSLVILGHYFKKRLALVNGLVTFGCAVFTAIYALLLPVLITAIGLRYSLLVLSAMNFLLIPYALTWRPIFRFKRDLKTMRHSWQSVYMHVNDLCFSARTYLNVKIWRNRGYVMWIFANGVSYTGYIIPFVHLVKHAEDWFPTKDGNLLPMFISITSGLAGILFGLVAERICISHIHTDQITFLLVGVTTFCIPYANTFSSLIALCLLLGMCDGFLASLEGPIIFDLVGESGASQALGFLYGVIAIPSTAGPPIAGWMYDHLSNYRLAFHVAGIPPVIGALMMCFIPHHRKQRRLSKLSQEISLKEERAIIIHPGQVLQRESIQSDSITKSASMDKEPPAIVQTDIVSKDAENLLETSPV